MKMNRRKTKIALTAIITTSMVVAGCATPPDKIEAKYVSPLLYQSYTCEQLRQEMHRIGSKAQTAISGQAEESNKDAAAMGVGLVLFWPALLFFASDKDREAEVAQLKGEMEAMEHTAIQKNCHSLLAQIAEEREVAEKRAEEAKEAKAKAKAEAKESQ